MDMKDNDHAFPSKRLTRILLIVGVPLIVLGGVRTVSWAAAAIKSWTSGETLTAADLNGNFAAMNARLDAMQAQLDIVAKSGTWILRATRNLSMGSGQVGYVDTTSLGSWNRVTDLTYDPFDGGMAQLPNSTRHYRMVIRSANSCQPTDALSYRLWFGGVNGANMWDNDGDNRTYPGKTYWGWDDEGGWETIDLDHISDPVGTYRPGFWRLEVAIMTNASGNCAFHRVKGVQLETWDVLN
jgi:hypothetical protein